MITIFGSSTAYVSLPEEGKSYVNLMKDEGSPFKNVHSYCMNGYTIWHANYMLPKFLTERSRNNIVILHVGACEAMTMQLSNFLELSSYWLNYGQVDHFFLTYIAPKIYLASVCLNKNIKRYMSLLTTSEFFALYSRVIKQLEGYRVLAIGMSKPKEGRNDIREAQAILYDEIIKKVCGFSTWSEYISVWDLCSGEVVDSNHLTPVGHKYLYDEIRNRLNG